MYDGAGRFERDLSDGLTQLERAVLAQWDAGAAQVEIALATGASARTVAHICELYDDRPEPEARLRLVAANAGHVAAVRRMQQNDAERRRQQTMLLDKIVDDLIDDAEEVFRKLFPNAVKQGNEMCIGSIDGEPGQSLRMNVSRGPRRGFVKDFGGSWTGNILYLIRDAECGGDIAAAVRWAKIHLKLPDAGPMDEAAIERHRVEREARVARQRAAEAAEREKIRSAAVARWLQGHVLTAGDPVACYLRARGIDLALLPRLPGALRYHDSVQYGFGEAGGAAPYRGPAMVAQVNALDGAHIATHRTWLACDGGRWTKAGAAQLGSDKRGKPNDPKKVMGLYKGGHIAVWKGAHRHPLRDLPEGVDVYVTEGIEDALTVACADPSLRVLAGISVSNIGDLELPAQMGRLIIVRQNDPPGSQAAIALTEAVGRQRAAGRRVFFVDPPEGVKDVNELAQVGAGQ